MACCNCCCPEGEECCKAPGPDGICCAPERCCGTSEAPVCCSELDPIQFCCGEVCCNDGQYCCDGVCQDEPCEPACPPGETCYICCCCERDGELDCSTLDYSASSNLSREDCVTGVESPYFGNLFGDWGTCAFSYTEGECEAPPP